MVKADDTKKRTEAFSTQKERCKMSSVPEGVRCENCVFYEPHAEHFGICRKYAPHPHMPHGGMERFSEIRWPNVRDKEWCGEFSKNVPKNWS